MMKNFKNQEYLCGYQLKVSLSHLIIAWVDKGLCLLMADGRWKGTGLIRKTLFLLAVIPEQGWVP